MSLALTEPVGFVTDDTNPPQIDTQGVSDTFFEMVADLSLGGRTTFPPSTWIDTRHGAVHPIACGELSDSPEGQAEFLRGAEALGLGTARKPIQPQQYVIADALNAGEAITTLCVPRRASKTTSIFAVAIGRCLEREDYQVAFTAQSGVKARDRFLKDVVLPLERTFGETDLFKINRSRGGEHIRFANGSLLTVLPPIPDSFRGDAFDMVIADESQEHAPDLSAELLGAILPTFDTRPGAQLIIAGTAGLHRSGLLWDALEQLRAGTAGGVEFAAPDSTPVHSGEPDEPVEGTTADPAVWATAHPGIGNLTPLSAIERNHKTLPTAQFMREYLGIWPLSAGSRLFDGDKWAQSAFTDPLPDLTRIPFELAYALDGDGRAGAVALAWRDDTGRAHVGLVRHSTGAEWLPAEVSRLALKYKKTVAYDSTRAQTELIAATISRKKPKPRLEARKWPHLSSAAALFLNEFNSGNLTHYAQEPLTAAVQVATKSGTYNANRWNFRPPKNGGDIAALDACALALHHYDELSNKRPFGFIDLAA